MSLNNGIKLNASLIKKVEHVENANKQGILPPLISGLLAEKQAIWGYSVAPKYIVYFNLHLS